VGALSPQVLKKLPQNEIAGLIHSSGYYNAKARKLKAMVDWLYFTYEGDIERISVIPTADLRRQLLSVHGVGPETADSILLYAANKPVFVIDAYTRRIFSRLGVKIEDTYDAYREYFIKNLPEGLALFNEYHALLVCHGKNICKKSPCVRSAA
jgi:endonuclease-3 related protein